MTVHEYLDTLADCTESVVATGTSSASITMNDAMARCVRDLRKCHESGGVVHLVGNGGSAAIVAHVQNDLMKAAGIRALVHQDVPLLTAYANDEGYPQSVAGPLTTWLGRHDVLIIVSSSGMSDNIIAAAELAHERGAKVITFSGFEPSNTLRGLGYVNFYAPLGQYGFVELTHAALLHYLTDALADA
jgi:D-sedoheptulose 7-phosphate isomerase